MSPLIEPLRKGDPYPGRRPPVREQWRELTAPTRWAIVVGPTVALAAVLALNLAAGAAVGVLVVGAAAATVMYVKNRTDRHNAAIDRGELVVPDDPHIRRSDLSALDAGTLAVLDRLGYGVDVGTVKQFDGGWIVRRRNPRDIAVVIGSDGGVAFFDPRWVPDLVAATEFLAGRGREPV